MHRLHLLIFTVLLLLLTAASWTSETLWIEAETLDGIDGYCWPTAASDASKTTHGKWGLSGPGCAPEWMQGGESGFLSIACGAADANAVATKQVEIPAAGQYFLWVRYRDNRGQRERFRISLEQAGQPAWTGTYGEKPVIDEDNTIKLYWNWAFGWDGRPVTLQKGAAKLTLASAFAEGDCRQLDVIVITNDAAYRPRIKERPQSDARAVLDAYRQGIPAALEPLARKHGVFAVPAAWAPKTFKDRGFLYLWNVADYDQWAAGAPGAVKFPYCVRDADLKKAFEAKYGGKDDVPIFSDPRIVPAYHGAGPWVLDLDDKNAQKKDAAAFRTWLDADPNRLWAGMMNYAPDNQISAQATNDFLNKYRDRFVGSIAGESLGYFYVPANEMKAATAGAKTRRELVEGMSKVMMATNAAKYRKVFGQDLPDPYRDVISCASVGMTAFASLCYQWGARTVGFESAVATYQETAMNLAFLRGAARQNGGMTATYRSCNFGDSATMFSETGMYTGRNTSTTITTIPTPARGWAGINSTSGTSIWPARRCSITSRASTSSGRPAAAATGGSTCNSRPRASWWTVS